MTEILNWITLEQAATLFIMGYGIIIAIGFAVALLGFIGIGIAWLFGNRWH